MSIFEDDPEFGAFVANYPSNRARLLLLSGAILAAVWFVITVALWRVETTAASIVTVGLISLATLGVGWYAAHFWNREVTLYQRGMSYREGSYVAFIRYTDIISIRQKAERFAYFGGLIRRVTHRTTLKTIKDETIVLSQLYRRVDELSQRLEQESMRHLKPLVERQMGKGEKVPFGDRLALGADGLHQQGDAANRYNGSGSQQLNWDDFAGYSIQSGKLVLASKSAPEWAALPLEQVDNVLLLLDILKRKHGNGAMSNEQ